jgi:hypothetical protein
MKPFVQLCAAVQTRNFSGFLLHPRLDSSLLLGQTALITTFLADAAVAVPTPANASNLAV